MNFTKHKRRTAIEGIEAKIEGLGGSQKEGDSMCSSGCCC